VLDLAPPSKAPYRLNQKELEKLKKNWMTSLVRVYSTKQVPLWGINLVCW
jgi:hypothetical protein